MITITTNADKVGERFKKFSMNLPVEIDIAMKDIAKAIKKQAVALAPGLPSKNWTGNLKKSIHIRTLKNNIKITVDTNYASAQEYGFKRHLVSANKIKIKKWIKDHSAENAIIWIKRKPYLSVGKQPNPYGYFLNPAVRIIGKDIKSYIIHDIKKAWMKS